MAEILKVYGCEGPHGVACTDRQAARLEGILQGLPRGEGYEPRRLSSAKMVLTEFKEGERADVSLISCEDPDRDNEVVLSRGMNDSHYALNPLVTLQHATWRPPVGRCQWRKRVRDGAMRGIKAKTVYPPRPATWPEGQDWEPDLAFGLVQAELLRGKSIGFLPLVMREPTAKELEQPGWARVQRVIQEWLLLEYACVFLPCQQHAVVEAVSKGLKLSEGQR